MAVNVASKSDTYGTSKYCSDVAQLGALAASLTVLAASSGNLYGSRLRLDATAPAATYYIQWLDSGALPGDGAVTHLVAPFKIQHALGVDDYLASDFRTIGLNGVHFTAGCFIVLSTSEFTKTIAGAYLAGDAQKA